MSLRDTRRHMKRTAVDRQLPVLTRNSQPATRNFSGQVIDAIPPIIGSPMKMHHTRNKDAVQILRINDIIKKSARLTTAEVPTECRPSLGETEDI